MKTCAVQNQLNGVYQTRYWCELHQQYVNTCPICLEQFHTDNPGRKTCSAECLTDLRRINIHKRTQERKWKLAEYSQETATANYQAGHESQFEEYVDDIPF